MNGPDQTKAARAPLSDWRVIRKVELGSQAMCCLLENPDVDHPRRYTVLSVGKCDAVGHFETQAHMPLQIEGFQAMMTVLATMIAALVRGGTLSQDMGRHLITDIADRTSPAVTSDVSAVYHTEMLQEGRSTRLN